MPQYFWANIGGWGRQDVPHIDIKTAGDYDYCLRLNTLSCLSLQEFSAIAPCDCKISRASRRGRLSNGVIFLVRLVLPDLCFVGPFGDSPMLSRMSRFDLFLFLGLLKAPMGKIPERVHNHCQSGPALRKCEVLGSRDYCKDAHAKSGLKPQAGALVEFAAKALFCSGSPICLGKDWRQWAAEHSKFIAYAFWSGPPRCGKPPGLPSPKIACDCFALRFKLTCFACSIIELAHDTGPKVETLKKSTLVPHAISSPAWQIMSKLSLVGVSQNLPKSGFHHEVS